MIAIRHPLTASLLAVLALTLPAAGWEIEFSPEQAERIDAFLGKLELRDLQADFLRRQLNRPRPVAEQQQLAVRLGKLYAQQLAAAQLPPAEFAALQADVAKLLERHPEAKTAELEVTLLQAQYAQGERLATQWLADSKNRAAREQAVATLQKLADPLHQLHQRLNAEADALVKQARNAAGEQERKLEQQALESRNLGLRASYFGGWSSYYLARVSAESGTVDAELNRARAAFRDFLALTPDDKYDEVEASWLGLESVWRSRALIGLALVEAQRGRLDDSLRLFDLLDDPSVPPQLRDQAAHWRLEALLSAEQWASARDLAAKQQDRLSRTATPGAIGFWSAAIRGGASEKPSPEQRTLLRLGLRGLVKLRQYGLLLDLAQRHDLAGDDDFYARFVAVQAAYTQAETTQQPEAYRRVIEQAAKALADPAAGEDAAVAGELHYLSAWSHYRLEAWDEAVASFEKAEQARAGVDRESAAEAAWMTYVAQEKAGSGSAALLERIVADYAGASYAQRAERELARASRQEQPLSEQIAALAALTPREPGYADSRVELCRLLATAWTREPMQRAAWGPQLADAITEILDRTNLPPNARLRSVTYGLAIASAGGKFPAEQARGWANAGEQLAAVLDAESDPVRQFHEQAFQWARVSGDQARIEKHARWLTDKAPSTPSALAALMLMASGAERRIAEADESGRPAARQAAITLYRRLFDRLGSTSEAIAGNKNARVAANRLAALLLEAGQAEEAAEICERIVAAAPRKSAYLQQAMAAQAAAGNSARALALARKLVSGLPAGSPGWFSAKWHQIAELAKRDRAAAKAVLEQLKLLQPEMGGPEMRKKFDALERTLR